MSYFAAWSSPSDASGDAIRSFYAPVVDFYGKSTSVDQLIAAKAAFAKRWPTRSYVARPASVVAQCADPDDCKVTGVLDWSAADQASGRHSAGVAAFSMTLRDGLIVGEAGQVLSRE